MLKDKETLAIISLLIFVVAIIGAGFVYVYNDNLDYGQHSDADSNGAEKEDNNFSATIQNKEGKPLGGVLVSIEDNGISIDKKTDESGFIQFFGISTKRFLITIKAKGYTEKKDWFLSGQSPKIILTREISETKTILKLHGSNTIGAKYAPALVKEFLNKMGVHSIESKNLDSPEERVISGIKGDKRIAVEIKAHGSSTGFKSLKENLCDIGMASRGVKDKEYMALAELGDMRSFASEHVVGLDGIAVIVHQSNLIQSISVDLLGKIFTGEIKSWKETGSNIDGDIVVYSRDGNSGTYDTFKSLILKKRPLIKGAKRFESNANLSDAVSKDSNAIGFTGLPYIRNSRAVAVSVTGGAKVFPTFFTVATEDYPISRRLYMYTPSVPKNPHTLDFVNFVLSDAGQKIAKEIGFVDLSIKTFVPSIDTGQDVQNKKVFEKYLKLIEGAGRLSLNFRFRSNSFILDNRGMRDLKRVVEFLKQDENSKKRVVLIGFADGNGDYAYNYELATKRAKLVADELRSRGVYQINLISVGEEVPVASNLTSSGRSKNRRVEVWIKD